MSCLWAFWVEGRSTFFDKLDKGLNEVDGAVNCWVNDSSLLLEDL